MKVQMMRIRLPKSFLRPLSKAFQAGTIDKSLPRFSLSQNMADKPRYDRPASNGLPTKEAI